MGIRFSIDTNEPLTKADFVIAQAVLNAVLCIATDDDQEQSNIFFRAHDTSLAAEEKFFGPTVGQVAKDQGLPSPAQEVAAAKAEAAKQAPAKKAAAKAPAAPAAAPEPEPEPAAEEEAPEELEAAAEDAAGVTLEDAVTAATELVGQGKTAVVKKALNAVGAKRVSEIKPELVADFLAALEG